MLSQCLEDRGKADHDVGSEIDVVFHQETPDPSMENLGEGSLKVWLATYMMVTTDSDTGRWGERGGRESGEEIGHCGVEMVHVEKVGDLK